jgi:hypothetical protein
MTSLVFTVTAVVSSKLLPKYTLPAPVVAESVMMNPLIAAEYGAVAVANVTWPAAEPRPAGVVVPTVPHDPDEIVCRT